MAAKEEMKVLKLHGGCLDCGGDLYSVGLYPRVNAELMLFMCESCGLQHEMPLLDPDTYDYNLQFPVEGF
jgi:transcription elongation factor Elf1